MIVKEKMDGVLFDPSWSIRACVCVRVYIVFLSPIQFNINHAADAQ
jgi:hypothetical protein